MAAHRESTRSMVAPRTRPRSGCSPARRTARS
jgi:hypothetical protein